VQFCFLRSTRPLVAASAFALLMSLISGPMAYAQGAAAQQPAAAGQQPQKNYKDRAEYDLYSKITQTQDPKARLELLNTWQDKYPQSDFAPDRLLYFVATLAQLAPSDPTARQKLLDKCAELLKSDPKNFRAMYLTSVWGQAVGGTSPSPDLLSQVDSAAHGTLDNIDAAFDPSKKPANVSDADFAKLKNQASAIAHNALAWEAIAKKDNATAESEYKASLQANPEQGNVSAALGKMLITDKKYPEGLFEYARAGEYDGAGSLPAATRQQLLDYFNKAYKDYHGSADGADQLLAQAKTDAVPPAGLSITSQAELANKEADAMNSRIASDPQFKLWYTIKTNLTGDQGDQFFNNTVKDAEIPGGAEGVKDFTGTVISIGVDDPTKPDATLLFSQPLPASALEKIKVGQKLDFSGVADSYTKDPYMLTFKDPTVPGVQTTAPARTGRKGRKR
jgi:hypothetical protein